MKYLFTRQNNLITLHSPNDLSTEISRFMNSNYTCLCCSHTLLRHVSSGRIYWRCSSCYQEMPVYKTT